ncbi:Hypothetical predicted protein [Marmota monax]|uniref:Nuclear cap-binding protein subunit 2 n=1 Tax=Marmota monax TaxID=9995 RepID=A0A5E4B339_MARMO|nr:hypothetical protein GHT09_005724 [Marmota monax]VTJ64014.1 Hypothetical predicted protein [Marmota monax]
MDEELEDQIPALCTVRWPPEATEQQLPCGADQCRDQPFRGDSEEQEKLLKNSCTSYVENLSFNTTEKQIYELFSKSGDIKKIIMGLYKVEKKSSMWILFCGILFKSRCKKMSCSM